MRKIFAAVLIFSFHVSLVSAQNWKVGVKGGLSLPNLRAPSTDDGSFSSGYKSVTGPQAGLIAEYSINDKWSIQTELNYTKQGGEKTGNQRIRTAGFESYFPTGSTVPPYLYARFDNKISLAYLELPILAKYNFNLSDRSTLSLLGGFYVGYLLKAKDNSTGKSKVYKDPGFKEEYIPFELDFNREENIIDQCNKISYGFQGGAKYAYDFESFELFVAGEGTYGFKYLQKDPKYGQNKTGGATLSIGAAVKL